MSKSVEKKRVAYNNGRANKHGEVYSPKHNDRDFDLDKAEHIDASRTKENVYFHRYQKEHPNMKFEDAEKKFYKQYFQKALDVQNAKYIKTRHLDRCKTTEDLRKSPRTCPEETLYYVGNVKKTITAEQLLQIYKKQIQWEQKKYPQHKYIDIAVHVDEEGAPHIHSRSVWIAHDKNGNYIVSQEKSLAEMGIQRPDLTKDVGRKNNAKMTYIE